MQKNRYKHFKVLNGSGLRQPTLFDSQIAAQIRDIRNSITTKEEVKPFDGKGYCDILGPARVRQRNGSEGLGRKGG